MDRLHASVQCKCIVGKVTKNMIILIKKIILQQARSPSAMSNKLPQPEVQIIKLHKNSNGMGLSIVAAKGAGQERLGIYIKSVVPGGAADADGRLQAGDQLLRVDGQSLIGITQER